ncbi:MAG: hypothetical protein JSW55_15810 [Chloroflexota bacterium]|nr:MAG: hypothetical protein JSW55_15810 [Chloroflexota bacterium]
MTLLQEVGEFGGILVGFLLTLCVLSFVIKDNPLYRVAVHILVGVSAAFAVVIVVREVFNPVFDDLRSNLPGNGLLWIVPMILAFLLLLKAVPRTSALGNSALAVLMAIGAAVGFVGAIAGTLLPQILVRYDNALLGLLAAGLTISTLAYFFFTSRTLGSSETRMPRWHTPIAALGRVVITVTLAGLFAGILNTSLVILTQRVGYYIDALSRFFSEFVL